jgi:membrane protease YdiL (CAAX protease family)
LPNLRVGAVLGLACALGAAAVVPYLAALLPEIREAPLPLWGIALVSALQTGLLATGLATIGLKAGASLGLGAPYIQAWVNRSPRPRSSWSTFTIAIGAGLVAAAALVAVDAYLLVPNLSLIGDVAPKPGPVEGLLASFYGGIAEEVMLRLFAVSVLAWGFVKARLARKPAVVAAVIVAAVLFGVGHLPTAADVFEMSGWLVFRTLLLNGVFGIVFGYFYVRRGLEHAIASHFAVDLVLHVAVPML